MADLSVGARILRETTSQNLAVGALDYTTGFNFDVQVMYVHLKFSAAVTQDITITFDSASGANYDAVMIYEKTSADTDYIFRPVGYGIISKDDNLRIQCSNTGTPSSTVYMEIVVLQE